MADSPTDDFLDAPEPPAPAYAEETIAGGASRRNGIATWMSTGAWLFAGLVIGALVVAMLHTNKSTEATGLPAANQAPSGQAPTGQIPNGQIPPGGGFGGGFGGLPGEQHIVGTLTAVGSSSITVNSATGTATYPIESSTLLVKDGQRVSSLSALKTGDTVVVHVYPQNGSTHTEMVIDGDPGGRGGFGGRHDGGPDDDNDTGNSTGPTTET